MQASEVARVVIALAVAVALAVLGAQPRVLRWERRFGLTVLASSGFPFLLLGVLFRELGVLTNAVLTDMRPLFEAIIANVPARADDVLNILQIAWRNLTYTTPCRVWSG